MTKFKFDIAFSLLHPDLDYAKSLFDVLDQYKLNTFLYVHNQKDLAANNGINVFSKVFKNESRIVVLLYRHGYGETPWTRIEHTAIQERYLKEGADFCVLIPMDKTKPLWYPAFMQYVHSDMDSKDVAALILQKLKDMGGELTPKTIDEYLEEANNKRNEKITRYRALFDKEKYNILFDECLRIKPIVQGHVNKIIQSVNFLDNSIDGINNPNVLRNKFYLGKVAIELSLITEIENSNTPQAYKLKAEISQEKKGTEDLVFNTQFYGLNYNSENKWGWSKIILVPKDAPLHYPKMKGENYFYEYNPTVEDLEYIIEYWFTEFIKTVFKIHNIL